jgi:peptidoglycan/xylan/chitin deacetylase (PgdA/CDA1 family)
MLTLFSAQIFMGRAQRRLCERGCPVFTYHKIGTAPAGALDPFLFVTPDSFAEQLDALNRHKFVSSTLMDLCGESKEPRRRAILTFDDGCQTVFKNGLPILAKFKYHAIQFIVADLIGKRNEWDVAKGETPAPSMDKAEIMEWLAAGHEIGSHTSTHPNLKRVSLQQAREEIFGSKRKLEDMFGIPIRHFCYPSGKSNDAIQQLVGEAGYLTACTVKFGVNTISTPRLALNRIVPLSQLEWIRKARHRLVRRWLAVGSR